MRSNPARELDGSLKKNFILQNHVERHVTPNPYTYIHRYYKQVIIFLLKGLFTRTVCFVSSCVMYVVDATRHFSMPTFPCLHFHVYIFMSTFSCLHLHVYIFMSSYDFIFLLKGLFTRTVFFVSPCVMYVVDATRHSS
jgi:hypothetical protein